MTKITKSMLLAAVIFAVGACAPKTQEEPSVTVGAIVLKDTSCVLRHRFPATLQGIQDVAIYPQVSGRITEVKVKEGQFVKKDEVLFTIDDVPYKAAYEAAAAQVEVAKANLASAKLTLESKTRLFNQGVISDYQLKLANNSVLSANASLLQAEASLKDATNNLSFTKVRTMSPGRTGTIPYKVGALVGNNITEPLTVVSDNSKMYADFSINENIYIEIAKWAKNGNLKDLKQNFPELQLITNDGALYKEKGVLHSISGIFSASTGSLPCRAVFPNSSSILLSGGSAQVVFSLQEDHVYLIPRSSIKEIQNKLFVFRIKNAHLEQVEIHASRYDANNWLLGVEPDGTFPINKGDSITNTINRIKNGDKVIIKK